jgi:hypothetical protein
MSFELLGTYRVHLVNYVFNEIERLSKEESMFW